MDVVVADGLQWIVFGLADGFAFKTVFEHGADIMQPVGAGEIST